jgi:Protein of unknown function (DUF2934)
MAEFSPEQRVTNLFGAGKIDTMQSEKASKKMNKNANEPVQPASAEVSAPTEKAAKPRVSKSSKSKSEPVETASAKRHRKPVTVTAPETIAVEPVVVTAPETVAAEPIAAPPVTAPKVMAAAAGSANASSVVIDPVGVDVPAVSSTKPTPSYERIRELAYQFWLADGGKHGKHDEHWLRAERELELVP